MSRLCLRVTVEFLQMRGMKTEAMVILNISKVKGKASIYVAIM